MRARALVLVVALAAFGCAGPEIRRGVPDDGALHDVAYLVSAIEIPVAADGVVIGADLDGRDSQPGAGPTCEDAAPDFTSARDASEQGIDDAAIRLVPYVEALVGRSFDDALAAAIADGRLAIGIEVRGVSARGDGHVEVAIDLVSPFAGVMAYGPDGRPAAGQIVRATTIAYAMGELEGTTVRARFDQLALPISGEAIPMLPLGELGASEIVIDLDVDADGRRVAHAELGASLPVASLLDDVRELDPVWTAAATSILARHADLQPSAIDPMRCERISVAFAIEAVDVSLVD